MHVLLAGASGMIGTAVKTALIDRGDTLTTLVRRAPHTGEIAWDPARGELDPVALREVDAVIGFSGSPVGQLPWTKATKARIRDSRVTATRTLATAIVSARDAGFGPTIWVNASGINAYGNTRTGERLTETSPMPSHGGFLCEVVQEWEAATQPAERAGVRVAHLRTAIVTGRGGAIDRLELLAKAGLAGPIGRGTTIWPWISLRDEVAAILHILDGDLWGPVNLVAPKQTSSADVIRAVAQRLHRPYWLPAPRFAMRAVLGSAADDLLLIDLPAVPAKLLASGFTFRDETIEQALSEREV